MRARPLESNESKPRTFFARNLTMCRKATPGLVAVAVLVPVILVGRGQLASLAASHEVKVPPPAPPSVRVVALADEAVELGISYSATVRELRKAELSFRVGGTLDALLQVEGAGGPTRAIHEGDQVARGAVLAALDPGDYTRERAGGGGTTGGGRGAAQPGYGGF